MPANPNVLSGRFLFLTKTTCNHRHVSRSILTIQMFWLNWRGLHFSTSWNVSYYHLLTITIASYCHFREGRCALSTAIGSFKYMVLYSFIQFSTILILFYVSLRWSRHLSLRLLSSMSFFISVDWKCFIGWRIYDHWSVYRDAPLRGM